MTVEVRSAAVHEAYAYGVIAPSTLVELVDDFPDEAGYAEIAEVHPSIGGEAAAGAFVLARLGVATRLTGTRLGADAESARVVGTLEAAGVDCSAVATDAAAPVTEIVVTGHGQRTVLGTYRRMLEENSWTEPSPSDIAASRIVCLDPFFGASSERAARHCVESSVPYVTVDVTPESSICAGAAAVVVSAEFLANELGTRPDDDLLAAYTARTDGLVVLTDGGAPVRHGRAGTEPRVTASYAVDARDTTGAGDAFRAGVVYGMLRGLGDDAVVETASAVAAMVCLGLPGVLGTSPTPAELAGFIGRARST